MSTVAIVGSRQLPQQGLAAARLAAQLALANGHALVTGCCAGADAAAICSAVAHGAGERLLVLCAFGPLGQVRPEGSCRWSAVMSVCAAQREGAKVVPWAGGGPSVPLRVRLRQRSESVGAHATAALVAVMSSPWSAGSLVAARVAARRGVPIIAVPVGFSGLALPLFHGARVWSPAPAYSPWSELGAWLGQPAPTSEIWQPDPHHPAWLALSA